MTKLLVASGWYKKKSVEIVNLDEDDPDLICDNLPELQQEIYYATGQLLEEIPVICNVLENSCNCQAFQNGSWKFVTNERACRFNSTVSESQKDVFVIEGDSSSGVTVETFDGTVWHLQKYFPEPLRGGCIVKLNSSTIFYIGGYITDNSTAILVNNTYFYNALFNKWTLGPPLNNKIFNLGCGILKWKNPESNQLEKVVVATGGRILRGNRLSSVELLYLNDDNSVKSKWMIGPKLPKTVYFSTMIEYNNSVIFNGGSDGYSGRHQLYQLSSPKGPWIEMKQTLKEGRYEHVSFLVSDELVNCHY